MSRSRRAIVACLLIALASVSVRFAGRAILYGPALERLQTAVADFLFLDQAGRHFGRRPASRDIVLVLFDQRAVDALNHSLPTIEQDLDLYRTILASGPRVVVDTRMIAETGDPVSSPGARLLAGMEQLHAEGRVLRDVWLSPSWPAEVTARFRPLLAHHVLNMHPSAEAWLSSRVYPLVVHMADGFRESMPLVVTRAALGLEQATSDEVLQALDDSRAAIRWQEAFPDVPVLPPTMTATTGPPERYLLGTRPVLWREFPSQSSMVAPIGFWINYDAPAADRPRLSYADVADSADQLRDKIVVIGYAADIDPSSDKYVTPASDQPLGAAEVVAAAVETLQTGRFAAPLPTWLSVTVALVFAGLAALAGGLLRPLAAGLAGVAVMAGLLAAAVAFYRSGWQSDMVITPSACLLAGALSAGYRYAAEIRARTRIVDLFGRYVPRAVVSQLVQKPDAEALALGGVKREVTVLFADVRGFTPFAERLPPEEVLAQLNSLLEIMVEATFAHGGTLDKFIGDAILVLFNAPLDQPDHALRAARTAWAIQRGVTRHPSGLSVGVGIHRGQAVVGTVGTPQRMEYTAIGSTVNIASRLCGAAASGQILVSAAAAAGLAGEFRLESLPPLHVKGVAADLAVSALVGPVAAPPA